MIVRNGIRSIFRAKKLCLLFLLLTGILSAVLSLGMGVYASADATLEAYRQNCRAVGRIEYIGGSYPDETAADPLAAKAYEQLDPEALMSIPGVLYAEKKNFTLGFTDSFKRRRGEIPYENYAVLMVGSMHSMAEELITVEVLDDPQLPDTYILTDAVSGAMTICDNGSITVLRSFTYDPFTRSYAERVYENGVYSENSIPSEELPENYVISSRTGGISNIVYHGSLDPEDRNIERFLYDPIENTYALQAYKVTEYTAHFNDALYSRNEERGILIRVRSGLFDFTPEDKHKYALHGSFVDAGTSNLVFEIREFSDSEQEPWIDITDMDKDELSETIFGAYAERYRLSNNYLNVYSSEDLELLEPFHQGWLSLAEGRFPKKYEDHVCVIDRAMADQMNLSIGSILPLSLLKSEEENLYHIAEVQASENYEVIGILAENNEYQGEVFISRKDRFDTPYFGCSQGFVLFDNEQALAAIEQVRSQLGEGMRITLYDQGYETGSQPFKALKSASLAVTCIGALASLASLVLFAFLYIWRQRETISTLSSLGLSASKIRLWMLSGVLSIVLCGSLGGALCGALVQSAVTSLSVNTASSLYAYDSRYSSAAAGYHKTIPVLSGSRFLILALTVIVVLCAAVLLSLLFIHLSMRETKPSRGVSKVKIPDSATSVKGKGVLRYGASGFERGGKRSAAVILICFTLSLLLCMFAAMDLQRQDDLKQLYENTEINGSIVSLNGRYRSDLIISENLVRKFNQSGFVKEFHVSNAQQRYWLDGEMPSFAATSFGEESRDAWIAKQCRLIFSDTLDAAPDFFYTPASIIWKDGYDESFLSEQYPKIGEYMVWDLSRRQTVMKEAVPALIPAGRFDEETLKQEEIEVESTGGTLRLKPVGIYNETSSLPGIYLPLALIYDPQNLYQQPEESRNYYQPDFTFTAGCFKLKSSENLSAFKDFLAKNRYSEVNNAHYDRTTILLEDAAFLDTMSTLQRGITFMRMIYPVLIGFTVLTGFLISWLMINGRRMDFAIMKGLGTDRFRVFMIFFLEQAYASLTGILPVLILSFFISKPLVIVLFAAAYLAGTALSIDLASRENLLVLLSEKE